MIKKRKPKPVLPQFRSEFHELTFWDNQDIEGFIEGPADDLILDLKPRRKRSVTLRLDEELINQLKRLSSKHGIPYQRLAREVLWRGVKALQAKQLD